jgi:hypothetical protein
MTTVTTGVVAAQSALTVPDTQGETAVAKGIGNRSRRRSKAIGGKGRWNHMIASALRTKGPFPLKWEVLGVLTYSPTNLSSLNLIRTYLVGCVPAAPSIGTR